MEWKIGSRESPLARVQGQEAGAVLSRVLPEVVVEWVWYSSPGDRDQALDLEQSPADFFTRDLDAAVREGQLDAALHSAKDFPEPMPVGLDGFWLPDAADRRDVWVGSLSPRRVGVSSERRRAYVQGRFPDAACCSLRGTIEGRLAQLDAGRMDALVMAGAALQRLGLEDRIAEWIPLDALATPDGQGSLMLVFREGDARFWRLRSLFVKPVLLVSGGPSAGLCTRAGEAALRRADVCLYDALVDPLLLDLLPDGAQRIYVGKRSGRHSHAQSDICALLVRYAREGKRVVRLKGGDAGLYGRLAEEVEALERYALPYEVLPGVSSLVTASTGTGLLLTRRGVTDRIRVLSGHSPEAHDPRQTGAETEVIFMGTRALAEIARERLEAGYAASTPVAGVYAAGMEDERVLCGTLAELPSVPAAVAEAPGLILIGEAVASRYRYALHGALRGRRVWLTCSEAVREAAEWAVRDAGGRPVWRPLIQLVAVEATVDWAQYDWLVVTSPSAVRCLLQGLHDVRCLPKILCCGPGTAAALRAARIVPDALPAGVFSTEGILAEAANVIPTDARVLRVRSDRAGGGLAGRLREQVAWVDDVVLYHNEALRAEMPPCDAILFASASAVESFVEQFGIEALEGHMIGVMGQKEVAVLSRYGVDGIRVPERHTLDGAVAMLARQCVAREILV